MLRTSIARAAGSSLRQSVRSSQASPAALVTLSNAQQTRKAHAISNPTLANIEKRWEAMPPQEQADLWMALRDRMKVDWNELTTQEKRAAYWIAFGPHGPRALPPPGEGTQVFAYTMLCIVAAGALFSFTRYFARGPPQSMTKEYQEASDAYLKESKVEPITGISADDFKGGFMVQSPPSQKK